MRKRILASRFLAVASGIGIVACAILTMIAWGLWSPAVRATFDTLTQVFVILFFLSIPLGLFTEIDEDQSTENEVHGPDLA
ncbi:MAG: hypothetical protein EAX95_14830 [Candidatus Thorarchaeota archaeon]|nr:hypothetical protein [Candidatus Thorarchaeota archaeon]